MTSTTARDMERFWDRKARENATYYISSFRDYQDQDIEEFWRWGETLTARFLKDSGFNFTGEERVLDVGCGIGRMTKALAQEFRQVTGVDVSGAMIEQAQQERAALPNVTFLKVDGTGLTSFEDGSFDLVFSYIALQHIPDPLVTLNYVREFGRVLTSGGHAVFQANNDGRQPAHGFPRLSRGRQYVRNLRSGGARDTGNPAWIGSSVSERQVDDACRDGGLTIVSREGVGTQYMWIRAVKQP